MAMKKDPGGRCKLGRKSQSELLLLGGLLGGLGNLSAFSCCLLNGLDDTNSNRLPHVTDGETAKRWEFVEGLHTHWLGGDHLYDGSVTRLDELGAFFNDLTRTTVNLLNELRKLACNVSSVAVEHWRVTGSDLTRVVEDNNLSVERGGFHRWVGLGVTADVSSSDVLDGNVLYVETDVVTWHTSLELFVVHFDGLDFGGDVGRSENDDHTGLDGSGLDTTDWHCADTTNLVDILERKTERLVGRAGRWLDGINGFEEGLSLGLTTLDVLPPSLEPGHVGGLLNHVVSVPS